MFVGGATVSLYATHAEAAEDVRPTEDIDVVVEVVSYSGYAALSEKLSEMGFRNDADSGVICRYNIHDIKVDIMPTEPQVIGFSNRWYPDGFRNAETRKIDENTTGKIFSLPYFIASKWEAFQSRGKGNFRVSHDFEDIVYVFEQCHDFEIQLKNAPAEVFEYLKEELGSLVDDEDFTEGISCHMQSSYYGADSTEIRQKLKLVFG